MSLSRYTETHGFRWIISIICFDWFVLRTQLIMYWTKWRNNWSLLKWLLNVTYLVTLRKFVVYTVSDSFYVFFSSHHLRPWATGTGDLSIVRRTLVGKTLLECFRCSFQILNSSFRFFVNHPTIQLYIDCMAHKVWDN